eukprot:gb/GEZN01009905.1/.p1 GENE.gb/GEZN01009905.1/~~gb/GEZN01009905.1/.p1  ORF type:complete len:345 (+),score=48.08 gb/GEZN01009905.1/:151-1185(+)
MLAQRCVRPCGESFKIKERWQVCLVYIVILLVGLLLLSYSRFPFYPKVKKNAHPAIWDEIEYILMVYDEPNSTEPFSLEGLDSVNQAPRQAKLLELLIGRHVTNLFSMTGKLATRDADSADSASELVRSLRVCEIGFGAGYSAALFLGTNNHTSVTSFDMFDHGFQPQITDFLQRLFPSRLRLVTGDPCQPLAGESFAAESGCDLLYGSGGPCRSSNLNLVHLSPCGAIISSAAHPSLHKHKEDLIFGEQDPWGSLEQAGCLQNISCFQEYAGGGAFCVAITSGGCPPSVQLPEFDEAPLFSSPELVLQCQSDLRFLAAQQTFTEVLPVFAANEIPREAALPKR